MVKSSIAVLCAALALGSVTVSADDLAITERDQQLKDDMDRCAKHPHQLVPDGAVNKEVGKEFAALCTEIMREWDHSGAHARFDAAAAKKRAESIGSISETLRTMDEAVK